ncbi:MAG TPA: CRTAC1 family protein [Candidatus Limnocylindria bacterium]|nr:CRTAC1 family protein [Candidatus Limnocylindria bacterium]
MNQDRARRPLLLGLAVAVAVAVIAGGALALRLVLPGTSAPTAAGPVPRFADEAASSGLNFKYDGPFTYALGGGVALFDCDDDGLPEVYLAGGEGPAALFGNDSEIGGPLRFTRLAAAETDLTAVIGAYPIDIDGDGVTDLVTLRYGENVVLRGLGGCRFERANEAWGLNGGAALTEAFSATWEGDAHWPTIAFGNFADPESDDFETWCQPNVLVRPADEGSGQGFGPPIELMPSFCTQSMLFSDWDGSGRKDLRVSNDRAYYPADVGEEQLWRITPGEAPHLYGVDDGWVRVQVEGMGIAAHDVTGDGLPEIYLTSQNANKLQALAAAGAGTVQPSYRDIGLRYGVNVAQPFTGPDTSLPSTAWHPEFDDVNNDGFIDLFVSKGNVTSQPDFALRDPSNLLLGGPDGTFREAADTAGILNFERGRGAVLADLNLDGKLDIILANYQAPVRVWRNTSQDLGGWLAVRLSQPEPNVDAIGAVVEVRLGDAVDRRELVVGGGHAGGELGWIAFGLGPNDTAEIRVTWPGSGPGEWHRVDANQHVVIDHSVGEPRPWPGEGE